MPLADQINALGQRSSNELGRLRAYYEHTKSAWRLAQQLADDGRTISIRNPATDLVLGAAEIHGLAQTYVTGYLAESVFEKSVSLLEDFLFGLLNAWLSAQPLAIPHKERQLTFSVILAAADKQAIVQHIIDKELNSLKYTHIAKWFEYLENLVGLGLPSATQIATLAEIKATRDVITHNAGVINDTYIRKAGAAARYKTIGAQVEIQEPYLYESWTVVESVFREMTVAALRKA